MTKRILLFDDDYLTMAPLKAELEELGYAVELSAARSLLPRLARERFDLICVDIMIHPLSPDPNGGDVIPNVQYPGVNWQRTGQEFLTRLRRGDYEGPAGAGTLRLAPVLILSATADPNGNYESTTVIEKPFDLAEVLAWIDKLLKG